MTASPIRPSLLAHGKSFALCGPSGAGKSTLINHLITVLDTTIYKPILMHYAGFNRSGLLRAIILEVMDVTRPLFPSGYSKVRCCREIFYGTNKRMYREGFLKDNIEFPLIKPPGSS